MSGAKLDLSNSSSVDATGMNARLLLCGPHLRCLATVAVGLALISCEQTRLDLVERLGLRPNQEQTDERIREIARLNVQRTGSLRITVLPYDAEGDGEVKVRYSLRTPFAAVEDTDIRGYRDGTVKYDYNQGTAYHLRVGRRYGGLHNGQLELKRSLIRWRLPFLPPSAHVSAVRVSLYIEAFQLDSPLAGGGLAEPLHLLVYPADSGWAAGAGGVKRNDFSSAAPGEATWTEARAGELAWAEPGALHAGTEPVGLGLLTRGDRSVVIEGSRLTEYVQQSYSRNRALELLLKLEDEEEDRFGTELGILSSQFGDDGDAFSRRPRLDMTVELPGPASSYAEGFVLEPGMAHVSAIFRHEAERVLLAAETGGGVGTEREMVAPAIFVRGGPSELPPDSAGWKRLWHPIAVDWDWSQFRVSVPPNTVSWGDTLSVNVLETWVRPGPRDKQTPELALIAPSGAVHRVKGRPTTGLRYEMQFRPTELGLWRYGWSFRPTPTRPLGGHEGEGVFYVMPAYGQGGLKRLEEFAGRLVRWTRRTGPSTPALQTNVAGFVRWATGIAERDAEHATTADSLIAEVRAAVEASR